MKLIDLRTSDGSRQFACLPRTATWQALGEHLARLEGAEVLNFVATGVAEAWLEFSYRGHHFVIRRQGDAFCFFVCDPQCCDLGLYQLAAHFEKLLGSKP